MTACPCCGLPQPVNPHFTGTWFDMEDRPLAGAYRCTCNTNRSVPWDEMTFDQKQEARRAKDVPPQEGT